MCVDHHERTPSDTIAQRGLLAALTLLIYALVAVPAMRAAAVAQAGSGAEPLLVLLVSILIAVVLVALSTIDAFTYELPDVLTLPLVTAGIFWHGLASWQDAIQHIAAAIIAFGGLALVSEAYFAWRGRAGIGLGDAKLLAAAGAWLGLLALPAVLSLATAAALATVAVAAIRHGRVALTDRLPFGPFLALAIWLVWLYGPLVVGPE